MKNLKSFFTIASLLVSSLLSTSSAFANTNKHAKDFKDSYKDEIKIPCATSLKGGLYFGAAAGYESYRVVDEASFANLASGFSFSADPRLNVSGAVGGAFIGFGHYFENLYNTYLAVELFGNGSAAKTDYELLIAPTTIFKTDIQVKSNYGIGLLPGIKLNNETLFYIRLGYNWSNIDVDEIFIIDHVATVHSDEAVTRSGFNYGLGVESVFYNNWSVRTEYTHTDYSKFDTAIETEINSADNQFILGLIYHFE